MVDQANRISNAASLWPQFVICRTWAPSWLEDQYDEKSLSRFKARMVRLWYSIMCVSLLTAKLLQTHIAC